MEHSNYKAVPGDDCRSDHDPATFTANIMRSACLNQNFRTAYWTGCLLQMTLMCIPVCGEIGLEIHQDTDQILRVEEGEAIVRMGKCWENLDFKCRLCVGDAVFVPAGTWHNVLNAGCCPLKLSSIYAPPRHPRGTIHRTKAEAEREEY